MGFLDFLKGPDTDQGVRAFRETPGAVLLDVRTPQEYREGRIPGSKNVPLQELDRVAAVAARRDTPLRLLPQRRQEQPGGEAAGPDGLYRRKKYRRHRRLHRKGGALT